MAENPFGELAGRAYDDLVHPSAKQLGDAIGRAFAVALTPASGALWSMERAMDWVADAVKQKALESGWPVDRVRPPPAGLLGAVVTGVQATAAEPALRQLFANLLASAMDGRRASSAHPAFASIIRELLPEEAALLDAMSRDRGITGASWLISFSVHGDRSTAVGTGLLRGELEVPAFRLYCDNLVRLGLVVRRRLDLKQWQMREILVAGIAEEEFQRVAQVTPQERDASLIVELMTLNDFGEQFLCACTEVGAARDSRLGLTERRTTPHGDKEPEE